MTIDEANDVLLNLSEKAETLTVSERELATNLSKSFGLPTVPVKVPPWAILALHSAILKDIPYISPELNAEPVHYNLLIPECDLRDGFINTERVVDELGEALDWCYSTYYVWSEAHEAYGALRIKISRGFV